MTAARLVDVDHQRPRGHPGSPILIAAAAPPPMSARPGPIRWIDPASGPPVTSTSTSPAGSGATQPSGLPRLITQPSLTGASARVSRCQTRWQSTYSAAAGASPRLRAARLTPPPADTVAAREPVKLRRHRRHRVAGSASSTISVDCRVAGETTVTASRMFIYPRSEDYRPVILCTVPNAARFN